jgi:DeoR family deoxyribose operon repressor
MTIRRDIAANPGRFAFLGGHIVPGGDMDADAPYELAKAADTHATAKKRACEHARKYLKPDETIFIDCGTTLPHLIDFIPGDIKMTAVCYAMNIAERLTRKPNVDLILLGGLYYPASASFSGDAGLETLNQLGINVAFISAAGVDPERGATCAHFHEAPVKRQAIAQAQKKLLVVDNSKIGRLKPAFFAETDVFDAIITEDGEISL